MKGGQGSRGLGDFENWIRITKKHWFLKEDIEVILNPRNPGDLRWQKVFYRKYLKECRINKNYIWITLSPDKKFRNMMPTKKNCEAVNEWIYNWLEYQKKFYGDYKYVLESGSNNEHLHVHFVAELLNSHKHAERLKSKWKRSFPKHELIKSLNLNKNPHGKGGEYTSFHFNDPNILKDKLDYMDNEKKGDHENEIDLGYSGRRGFNEFFPIENSENPVEEAGGSGSDASASTLRVPFAASPQEAEITGSGGFYTDNILKPLDSSEIEEITFNL